MRKIFGGYRLSLVLTRFCPIHFTLTLARLKSIVYYTENFVIQMFIKLRFFCSIFGWRNVLDDNFHQGWQVPHLVNTQLLQFFSRLPEPSWSQYITKSYSGFNPLTPKIWLQIPPPSSCYRFPCKLVPVTGIWS